MIKHFIIATLSLFTNFILAQTVITGLIEGNQTWTAANSPYQVTNGILKYGSKIVLEAGTKVEFKTEFVCSGEFIFQGTQDGWHLGDKIPVSFKNNYWDNRPADALQASIIDAEDDIKLAVVIGTEPQLTEKPIMKVADNPQITLPSVPPVIKDWAADKHVPQWIFKAVGILLLGLGIQYLVKKI